MNPHAQPFFPRQKPPTQGPLFKLLLTNEFGLLSKFGEFQHTVMSTCPDIAIVTETKLTSEKCTAMDVTLPGYSPPIRRDRAAQGGGVAVWVRSGLAYSHMEQITCGDLEVIWLTVQLQTGYRVTVCAAYRPGSCADHDILILEHIDSTIDRVRQQGAKLVIAGDFNVHNSSWLQSSRASLAGEAAEDMCALHGLTQHVAEPTRGNNTLDLIMSDFQEPVEVDVLPPVGKSDHAVVVATFSARVQQKKRTHRTVWRYNQAEWNRLRSHLRNTNWSYIITDDPDTSCQQVTATISNAVAQFVPSKAMTTKPSDPKWWTPECTRAMAIKDRHWRSWRRSPQDVILKQQFVTSVNEAVATLFRARQAKEDSLRRSLSNGSMHSKQCWTKLKCASGMGCHTDIPLIADADGHEYATSAEKLEAFGRFFAKKCSIPGDDISTADLPPHDLPTSQPISTIHFRPEAVRRVLARLDTSKASEPDEISARVLKECAKELASPLCQLFSLCFRRGIQPKM